MEKGSFGEASNKARRREQLHRCLGEGAPAPNPLPAVHRRVLTKAWHLKSKILPGHKILELLGSASRHHLALPARGPEV